MNTRSRNPIHQLQQKTLRLSFALLAVLAGLTGCNNLSERESSAAKGAAAGAAVGGVAGHQSDETAEGAAIGAAAGTAIGAAIGAAQEDDEVADEEIGEAGDYEGVDFAELLTDAEKERVRDRADEELITDWEEHLTEAEKRRLVARAER